MIFSVAAEEDAMCRDEAPVTAPGTGGPGGGGDAAGDGLGDAAPAPAPASAAAGSVTRSAAGTDSPSTLIAEIIEVFFQVYPGKTTRDGTAIGIGNVPYQLFPAGGGSPQSNVTDSDGRVRLTIFPGDTIRIRIFETDYNVRVRTSLEAVGQRAGMQRRLQMLGFHLGPDGVDGRNGAWTERAILDFQADHDLRMTGTADTATRDKITSADGVGE